MEKTTVYLPEALRGALKATARRRGLSEAEVIRRAIAAEVGGDRPRPGSALFEGEPIAARVDELLAGFGEW